MESIEHPVLNLEGKEVGKVNLPSSVYGATPKPHLVHEVVRWQLAKRRAGTHASKTRSTVSGSGAKLFRQKGTGRARAGSASSPTRRGGAAAFGPSPRDYSYRLPKKVKKQALCSVLSEKLAQKKLLIVDGLDFDAPKTKAMAQALEKLGVKSTVLLVTAEEKKNVALSARNLPGTIVVVGEGLNVYDMMRRDFLVLSKDALEKIASKATSSAGEAA